MASSLENRAVQLRTHVERLETVCRIINPRDLAFLHVPKTGGASVIQALDQFFDEENIAQAYNPPDFEVAAPASLYRGHMYGEQQARLFPDADHFTIVRDPVATMRSMYKWLATGGRVDLWREDSAVVGRIAGDDDYLMTSSIAAAKAIADMTFAESLSSTHRDVRQRMLAIQVRSLADGHMFAPSERSQAVNAALDTISRSAVVGTTEDLEMALWLLCDHRKWPAPGSLHNIHSSAPNKENDNTTAVNIAALYGEDEIYSRAKQKADLADALLTQKALYRDRIAGHLDRQADAFFFANAPSADTISYSAGKVWPGTGWGLRLRVSTTHHHHLGASGRSLLFAKVRPGTDCTVSMTVASSATDEALLSLALSVNGKQVPVSSTMWTEAGCVIAWNVGRDLVGNGHLRLMFETLGRPEDLAISSVDIDTRVWKSFARAAAGSAWRRLAGRR
jgi:hypothetical protein